MNQMETLQKPTLVRQVACSPDEVAIIDDLIIDHLRKTFYQGHVTKGNDWVQYARLREPDRTRDRAEFSDCSHFKLPNVSRFYDIYGT